LQGYKPAMIYLCGRMISEEDKRFMEYWKENRLRKKKVFRQLYIGLPLAVALVIAIFANFFSGWYRRATIVMDKEKSSLVLVLVVAALLIVAFVVVFSVRHRWDLNEQHYNELVAKQEGS